MRWWALGIGLFLGFGPVNAVALTDGVDRVHMLGWDRAAKTAYWEISTEDETGMLPVIWFSRLQADTLTAPCWLDWSKAPADDGQYGAKRKQLMARLERLDPRFTGAMGPSLSSVVRQDSLKFGSYDPGWTTRYLLRVEALTELKCDPFELLTYRAPVVCCIATYKLPKCSLRFFAIAFFGKTGFRSYASECQMIIPQRVHDDGHSSAATMRYQWVGSR